MKKSIRCGDVKIIYDSIERLDHTMFLQELLERAGTSG